LELLEDLLSARLSAVWAIGTEGEAFWGHLDPDNICLVDSLTAEREREVIGGVSTVE